MEAIMLDLVYCAAGNPRLVDIAHEAGWKLGMRSDASPMKYPPMFIDIDYKKPNFERHLEVVARYKPKYATVPDLSEETTSTQEVDRALKQAERLQQYCEIVLLVPKLSEQLALLPQDIAIGYSIPTSYGGAKYLPWELAERRIHLLGGSPRKQMECYLHLSAIATVMSADGNYAQLMATRYGQYWERHKWPKHPGVKNKEKDLYAECWQWSCQNIYKYWQTL
jgi:hypothetical protein